MRVRERHERDIHESESHERDIHERDIHERDIHEREIHVRERHDRDIHERERHERKIHERDIQSIAFEVSFRLILSYQSNGSLFNGTWQKRRRELDNRFSFANVSLVYVS